jgi:hypothetical protein
MVPGSELRVACSLAPTLDSYSKFGAEQFCDVRDVTEFLPLRLSNTLGRIFACTKSARSMALMFIELTD